MKRARPKPMYARRRPMARRKNYGRGYSKYRRSGFRRAKWVILIAVLAVALFVLISIAPAFYKLVTGQLNESTSSTVSTDAALTSSETVSTPLSSVLLSAVALPVEDMADVAQIQSFARTAKAEGYTAVTVTVKDENGVLLYASQNKTAQSIGASSLDALPLETIVGAIREAGLMPVASMHTFKDPKAAADRRYCYLYIDGSSIWLDNTLANGGKPWLSLYSNRAKRYLYALEAEVLEAGFTRLILDSVQFPGVQDHSTIQFPEGATEETHRAALADFVAEMQTRAESYGAQVTVRLDAEATLGEHENLYFGDPYTVGFTRLSPTISTDDLPDTLSLGEVTVDRPAKHPVALLQALQTAAGEDCVFLPTVSANGKARQRLLDALEDAGITEYLVTEP